MAQSSHNNSSDTQTNNTTATVTTTTTATEATTTTSSTDTEMCVSQDNNSSTATTTTTTDNDSGETAVGSAAEEKKDDKVLTAEPSAEDKKKWAEWPFRNIKEPHPHDVLYGRGGGTNHHPGNKRYRKKVEDRKVEYVNCKRLDKPLVALSIIREWRGQGPPGRFLKMDDKTGLWNDVGDKKAREKTSQALREKAPQIREEIEKEERAKARHDRGESSEDDDVIKITRFAAGTNGKPGMVARDHSLGVEYVDATHGVDIHGFSWQEPVRTASQGSFGQQQPPMPYGHAPGSRMSSHGSMASYGPPPPPMPPPPQHGGDPNVRYASWGRFESWGSMQGGPLPPMGYPYGPSVSGNSWVAREHSLGQNPLTHANVSQAAYPTAFDNRSNSGHWGPPAPQHPSYSMPSPANSPMAGQPPPYYSPSAPPGPHGAPPPGAYPPPPGVYPPPPREYSREYSGQHPPPQPPSDRQQQQHHHHPPQHRPLQQQPQAAPPSPKYTVDPAVASQWSGRDQTDIRMTMSTGSEDRDKFNGSPAAAPGSRIPQTSIMPRPDLVKRATSNQNENPETKLYYDGQSVKRAALNRDSSTAANALKEKYMPGYFDSKKEVEILSNNLQQSTLEASGESSKPAALRPEDRMSSLDITALDLVIKPITLNNTSRSSTIEALALDFDDEPLKSTTWDRSALMDDFFSTSGDAPLPLKRPSAMTHAQRLTTTDLIDIVNEPLPLTEV